MHKANDELSFVLDYKGETFFDDSGYSPFLPWDEYQNLLTEHAHGTIIVDGRVWSEKEHPDGRNMISGNRSEENGCSMEAEHYRCGGRMSRIVHLVSNSLLIDDFVDIGMGARTRHRFILGKGVQVENVVPLSYGYKILITKNGIQASLFCIANSCHIAEEYVRVVESRSPTSTVPRKALDVYVESNEERRIQFFITFDGTSYEDFSESVHQ